MKHTCDPIEDLGNTTVDAPILSCCHGVDDVDVGEAAFAKGELHPGGAQVVGEAEQAVGGVGGVVGCRLGLCF